MGKTTIQISSDSREKLEYYRNMTGFSTHAEIVEFLLFLAAKHGGEELAVLNYQFRKGKYGEKGEGKD